MPDDIFEDTYLGDYSDYLPFLKWMEKKFDCSGLCTAANLYLFSDINRGVPDGSCRQEIYDWIQDNFLTYGIIALAFGLFQV
ncbi:unnamed protein product [Blepharisma stoltei]|uniref:Uncharacterized protein n=1 Tax=Blepharisma stoltei TaxID=1481888 RepID=A0AAU9JEA1_9CILI|nr:unnamed protein product [Blepharisma stoltei]